MVYTYYEIGRYIVEDEQQGEQRAAYGKAVLKDLSLQLTERFGTGFSVESLDRMRYFYKVYSSQQISSTVLTKSQKAESLPIHNQKYETASRIFRNSTESIRFTLSWSHYLVLMRVENPDARRFYEIEATQQKAIAMRLFILL
jgi:3-methyladenine DNA glycosylase AlkC